MKNKHTGSTLDSLFEELGELEEVNALAAKKILAIQTQRRMKELGLTTSKLADMMGTSRNQVYRLLDQDDAGITLKVLFRLSRALQMPLWVSFGSAPLRARCQTTRKRRKTSPSNRRRIVGTASNRAQRR